MAKVLIIGSGGREHALAWKLTQSVHVDTVYTAPGNGGTPNNVNIGVSDFDALISFAQSNSIDLTIVGPEVPLAEGIVDKFNQLGLAVFGPVQGAAQIEASKAFSKDFMTEQGIPTGEYFVTDEYTEALKFLAEFQKPVVVKASGLAAGKGVIITDTPEEAQVAIHDMMQNNVFGDAGDTVVIEERLTGREVSVLAFCDGTTIKPMIMARDYKRALDGNEGLNTGGMGAIAPSPDMSPEFVEEVTRTTLQPVLDGMNALGTPYKGVLYAGLMLTPNGIKVLEYNCRFGDPESQVVLPLLKTDLYEIMLACINGTLDEIDIEWLDESAATVVCASGGYPAKYEKGKVIMGIETVSEQIVFHAGTAEKDGQLVTNGGRVLAVTALADTLDNALKKAYAGVEQIQFDDMQYRTDIGETYE